MDSTLSDIVKPVPQEALARLGEVAEEAGGEFQEPAEYAGSMARTMFDTPQSKDNALTLVLPAQNIQRMPAQSLVRIRSVDRRSYLGVVVEGPFAEPDGLRGDSPIVVTVTVSGSIFMPKYHGRVHVAILGEETEDGIVPPRFRPLPNSPVYPLDEEETAAVLGIDPPEPRIRLGLAVGHENLPVAAPAERKGVMGRHMAVMGTTGGGKTTTVSGAINSMQKADMAVVLVDTEGEYTRINECTDDSKMLRLLERRGLPAGGVKQTRLYHLVGRRTANPAHPDVRTFSLQFQNLAPDVVAEILEMTSAQSDRFHEAYDICKRVMADLGIFPSKEHWKKDEEELQKWDEMETGYPRMRLAYVYDMVQACGLMAKKETDSISFTAADFKTRPDDVLQAIHKAKGNLSGDWRSWRALQGKLGRLRRMGIFDVSRDAEGNPAPALDADALTAPGHVSILDLSDTDSPQVNNLVIAELLRAVHDRQDLNFRRVEEGKEEQRRTVVVIEEAHEFLSRERVQQMPVLFQQVARIARRGRKRWLGLVFVTQLPQHLPDEVLGLVNNYILHKIADEGVISRLKRSIGGIEDSLWGRLPSLAPGQAIVTMTSLTRPLLVAIDPTPCKLRMAE